MSKVLLEADNNLEKKLQNDLKLDLTYIKKLLALGEPFKKACETLGYNITAENGGNPLLAFAVKQKQLVTSGLLNANTFKAIYNAVAEQLVADSEFFEANNYNIIYCKNLYKKTPKEMYEYLKLQKRTLNPNEYTYTEKVQQDNRKTFLYISGIERVEGQEELNIVKRAKAIKAITDTNKIPTVTHAKLNNIELAKQIIEGQTDDTVSRSTTELEKIVKELTSTARKFAAILLLCNKSTKAKQALTSPKFKELNQLQIAEAFMQLSRIGVIPKEQLKREDADLLIEKIFASFDSKGIPVT